MQFARVNGTLNINRPDLIPGDGQMVVMLDSGHRVETVRDETITLLPDPDGRSDLDWSADQYTQETIAVDLAELGWEVFGTAEEEGNPRSGRGAGISPTYLVRRVGGLPPGDDDAGAGR